MEQSHGIYIFYEKFVLLVILRKLFRIFGPLNFAEEMGLTFRTSPKRNFETLLSS